MSEKQLHSGYKYKDKKGNSWLLTEPYVRNCKDHQQVINLFLSMVILFNGIKATPKELDFLTFLYMRGGVVSYSGKMACTDKLGITRSNVDNLISVLKKKKILIKQESKVRIHPKIMIDFNDHKNFIFQFRCKTITIQ